MRLSHFITIATIVVAPCGIAVAQMPGPYVYVARTAAPVARSGAVAAGTLTWACTGNECNISGPWVAPGVPACAALAAQVGRIVSYGRAGAMLTDTQLTQCNASLPQLNSNLHQIQPLPLPLARPLPSPTPTPTPAPTATPSQVALEPGGRPEDLIVHVLPGSSIRFFGAAAPLPGPALPPPSAPIVGGRIDSPGVRLQASAPGATPTARSATGSEAPVYSRGLRRDVVLHVPVSLSDMPSETVGIVLTCALFTSRFVPFITSTSPSGEHLAAPAPAYADLATSGSRSAERQVAFGAGWAYIRNIGHFEAVFDIALQTRPFFRVQDARSYQCDVDIRTTRLGGTDVTLLSTFTAASGPRSRPGFQPAAGASPLLTVEGNIQ